MWSDSDNKTKESSTDPNAETGVASSITTSSTETIEFPETSFAEYNQYELIGTGLITRTVEATIQGYEDPVALRSLDASNASTLDRSLLEQFVEGLEAWQTISDHEYVLRVLDIGETPMLWAALELADDEFEPVDFVDASTEQKLSFISQLCEAVHHGHRHGLAHGALSPSNVLIIGEEPSIRVSDWEVTGRALGHIELNEDAYGLSEHLSELGVSQSADIYAIGAVGYALFTGERVPADSTERWAQLDAADEVPVDLESTILKAINRVDQYETVLHLRDAIEQSI
jgi:serine/threonine protein kinase